MVCTLLAGVNVVAFAADDNDLIVSVNKFYNDATKGGDGEHLFTKDEEEMSWLSSLPTWNNEGEAWKAPVLSETDVWRCYNPLSGEHLYVDEGYADYLAGSGWNKEKVAFYSDDDMGVPVYRLWNGQDGVGSHHYTTNAGEVEWLVGQGWTAEDVAFYGVKEDLEVVDAVLDNEAPSMGDTITATAVNAEGMPVPGNYKYQWYRVQGADELLIKGANKASYTVSAADIGCSLYCVVTVATGEVFYTEETSKISVQEITSLEVKGMSGYKASTDKAPTIPVVGDILSAVTEPEVETGIVSYQWYRDEAKIAGATSATYVVQEADQDCVLKVVIKSKDETAVKINEDASEKETEKVCKDVSDLDVTLSKTSGVQIGDTVKLTVKDGSSKLVNGTDYSVKWYKDEVSPLNVLGTTTDQFDVDNADLLGHEVICVVTGKFAEGYINTTELSAGVIGYTIGSVAISADSAAPGVGTTLKATVDDSDDITELCDLQWFRDGVAIAGAENAKYTLTADDEGQHVYTVVAEGANGLTGKVTSAKFNVDVAETTAITGFVVVNPIKEAYVTGVGDVHEGDILYATTLQEAANSSMVYTWRYTNEQGDVETATGQTFVVPDNMDISNAATASKIMVTARYIGNKNDSFTLTANSITKQNAQGNNTVSVMPNAETGMQGQELEVADFDGEANEALTNDDEVAGKYYFLPILGVTGQPVAANPDGTSAAYLFNCYRAFNSASTTINNSAVNNPLEAGYKTYEAPQLGSFVHANVSPSLSGLSYQWYLVDSSENPTRIPGETDSTIEVKTAYLGQHLMCVVSGDADDPTDPFCGATIETVTENVVIPSDRTIVSMKIVDQETYFGISTVKQYNDTKAVTKLEKGKTYWIIGLDSEGRLVKSNLNGDDLNVAMVWDGTKSASYIAQGRPLNANDAVNKGYVTGMFVPAQTYYVGLPLTYTFNTELVDEETYGIEYSIAPGTIATVAGQDIVSTGLDLKATLTSSTSVSIDTVAWYEAPSKSAAGTKVADADTATLPAAKINDGKYYYVVFKDAEGKLHEGDRVLAQDPVVASLTPEALTDQGSDDTEAGTLTIAVKDQFGVPCTGLTASISDEFGDAYTVAFADGTVTVTRVEHKDTSDGGTATITLKKAAVTVAEATLTVIPMN